MKKVFFPLILFMLFVSCAHKGTPKNTLVVLIDNYPETFDPRMAIDLASQRVCELVYDGFFIMDKNGNLVNDIVQDYSFKNNRVLSFTLKKGVLFHNGDELTVDDVFFTIKTLIDKGSLKSGPFLEIGSMKKIDRYRGEIILNDKDPSFPVNLCEGAFGVLSQKDGVSGTGPYIVIEKRTGRLVKLKRFKSFFKGCPETPYILLKTVKDTTTRTFEMLNHSADMVFDFIPYENLKLFKNGGFKVFRGVSNSVDYIAFNFKDSLLNDRRVRKAICLAIDRDNAIKYLFYGYAKKASSMLSAGFFHFSANQCVSNITLANRILDDAGYKAGTDGYRFEIEFLATTSFISRLKAVYFQDRLKKIGIKLNIVSMDFGTFFDSLSKGKFQMYSARWVGILDPDIYRMIFYSSMTPPRGWNRGHYSNPVLDSLIDRARHIANLKERRVLYRKVNDIVLNDFVYIFLWYPENVVITGENIENLYLTPSKSFSYLYLVKKR